MLSNISLALPGKQVTRFEDDDSLKDFKRKLECWETCMGHHELLGILKLEDFADELSSDINKHDFLVLYNKTYQQLKDPDNSVNPFFPGDRCIMLYA